METKEYIESGILEFYIFGILSEFETADVAKKASENSKIQDEILSIEKAIMVLNFSISPKLSADNYFRIRNKIFDNNAIVDEKIITLNNDFEEESTSWKSNLGWVAALIFAAGIVYQYINTENQIVSSEKEKLKTQSDLKSVEIKNKNSLELLAIVRDEKNTIVVLSGQAVAPDAKAKVYYNQETQVVYLDASGLPAPPDGMEYQIWSLKIKPLTPTSIGLLSDFQINESKLFAMSNANGAEAFGITLEPKGGSLTPNMKQLYTFGKV